MKHQLMTALLILLITVFFIIVKYKDQENEQLRIANYNLPENTPTNKKEPLSWPEDLFSFVPIGKDKCEEFFKTHKKILPEKIVKELEALNTFIDEGKREALQQGHKYKIEGHSFEPRFKKYAAIYNELVVRTAPFVKTICETGFNGGHSSLNWLLSNQQAHLYSFDIGLHNYSYKSAKYIDNMFPGRFTITWGDSTLTLSKFHQQYPEVRCDLISVDGGHTYEVANEDIKNFYKIARHRAIITLDNFPDARYNQIGKAWFEAKIRGEIHELFHCQYVPPIKLGMSVGWVDKREKY